MNRPASITFGEIAHEIEVTRKRLEQLRALLAVQERQFMDLEDRGLATAGHTAARRLRAMKRAGI